MTAPDPQAVTAAAEARDAAVGAVHLVRCPGCLEPAGHATPLDVNIAETAVAATAPHIEVAVRREVAAAIRAEAASRTSWYTRGGTNRDWHQAGMEDAARIAEGGTGGEGRNGSATPPETAVIAEHLGGGT